MGLGQSAADVRIALTLDSIILPDEYRRIVNPSEQFKPGDPAWYMFEACASLPATTRIDTPAAAVMWSQGSDLQLKNLSIINTLLDGVDGSTHQAVALRCDGDRTQLENVRLIGRQDTFFVNAGERATPFNKLGAYATDRATRVLVQDSHIEGDTDYVFGRANAVFERCVFHTVSTRKSDDGVVFAPDTLPGNPFGFLVVDSRLTGDTGFAGRGMLRLGRSWDQGAGVSGYLPGSSPNGQLLLRNSFIDDSYGTQSPWGAAATTRRPHAGNANRDRVLDDARFNRLWEYGNYGPGSAQATNR